MYKKRTIVVNFISGPGAGKSTQAALLFARLKIMGYNVELITEYPKDKVWEESFKIFGNQVYLFAKQHHRMWRCHDKVDFIITDSPLIQYLAYSEHMSEHYNKFIVEEFNQYDNFNVFLERNTEVSYQQIGRNHTLEQAKEIDDRLLELVSPHGKINKIMVGESTVDTIIAMMADDKLI